MSDKYGPMPSGVNPLEYFKPSVIPSPEDARDHPFALPGPPRASYPPMYELPPLPVKNQLDRGACAAFNGVRMLEAELRKAGRDVDGSEEYVYAQARRRQNWTCQDSGSYPRDIVDILVKEGMPTEVQIPYRSRDLCWVPEPEVIALGGANRGEEYQRLDGLHLLKDALLEGYRVAACFTLFNNFHPDSEGLIPMPSGTVWGGHAMTFEGWDDNRWGGVWKVNNQWGATWGFGGYCYIPYAMASLPVNRGGCWTGDLWLIKVRSRPTPDPIPDPDPTPDPTPEPEDREREIYERGYDDARQTARSMVANVRERFEAGVSSARGNAKRDARQRLAGADAVAKELEAL